MRIALYGLPCSGKTTLLSTLKNVKVLNGSAELNRISNNKFKDLTDIEKTFYRKKYINFLLSLKDNLILSDGHYSFLENVVFTEYDAQAYDVFIYLFCSAETLLNRYANSEKNQLYANLTISRINQWQTFEIENIRNECHNRNKDFYVINGENLSTDGFSLFLEEIENGYSSYKLAETITQKIKKVFPTPCSLSLVDGDKTLIEQDSFRVCSNGHKTKIFDGNFYTGYQSLMFEHEAKSIEYNYKLINTIKINKLVFDNIYNTPYFVISAGISALWKKLSNKYDLKNVIANPLISADTKYFVVKLLQESGYYIKAYGDSKNDIYMLQAANEGYLCIINQLSKSLKGVNIKNLHLIYDHSLFVFNDFNKDKLQDEIAICKSNSGINGNPLAQAHYTLGYNLGIEISKTIPSNDASVLVLERGGRFFGDGVYMAFGGKFYPYNPSKEALPFIDSSIVLITDSVINTGQSILKVIQKLKELNANIEIIVVANVIQEKALPLLQNYKVYTIRISKNAFKGKNQPIQTGTTGPDTADRLFNLIKTK